MTDMAEKLLAMALEMAELRLQLAEAQDHLIEMAIDSGDLHRHIEDLEAGLAEARIERDAWRAQAERLRCA